MAGLGKVLKVAQKAYKVISAPSRKLHQLQEPFRGKNLSTSKKLANCILKPLEHTANATIVLSGLVGIGALATSLYAAETHNAELSNKSLLIGIKHADAMLGGLGGSIIGGPIGAIAGAAAALSTNKSILTNIAEASGEEEVAKELETMTAQVRQDIKNEVKELFGMTTSDEADKQTTKTKDEEKNTLAQDSLTNVKPQTKKTVKIKSSKLKTNDTQQADEKESTEKPADTPKKINLKGGLKLKKS